LNFEAYQILNQLTKLKSFTVILFSKKKEEVSTDDSDQQSFIESVRQQLDYQGKFQMLKNKQIQATLDDI
jgi:hypothetical protein